MGSARDADTFELESPFAEDFESLDEQDARLGPEAFDESPFASEFELLAEDVERPMRQRDGATLPSGLVLQLGDGRTGDHEDHWDPHNTGLPLLATGPTTHGERVSPHFTVREMVTSGGIASPLARISPQLVNGSKRSAFAPTNPCASRRAIAPGSATRTSTTRAASGPRSAATARGRLSTSKSPA